MGSRRHNPERRTWRGKSYRKAGNGPKSAENVRVARDESARKGDKASSKRGGD